MQIKKFLIGQHSFLSSRTKSVKIKFLLKVVNIMFVMGAIAMISSFFEPKNNLVVTALFYGPVFLSLFVFKFLLKRNKLDIAGWGLAAFFWLIVAFVTLFFGGLQGQNAAVFCVVVMFVGSIFGGRAAMTVAISTTLFCTVVAYLEMHSLLPVRIGPGYSPINAWSALAITLVLMSALIYSMLSTLSETEQQYRVLFDTNKDAMITIDVDPQSKFTSANKSALEMFGYTKEEEFMMVGPVEVSPEYQIDGQLTSVKAKQMIDLALQNGSVAFEWIHKRKNGEKFYSSVSLNTVFVGGRNILQGTIRDITEQREANRALIESEEKFRGLSEASFEAILIHKDGVILNYNNGSNTLLDLEEYGNLIGKFIFDFPIFQEGQMEIVKKKMKLGSEEPYTIKALRKNGDKWIAELQARKITYMGDTARVVAIRDVTEKIKAEEIIKKNTDLLKLQNHQLVDFCNIVSHNLRGPLVNLSMLINFLEQSKDEAETTLLITKLKPVITNLNETFEELVESIQIKNDVEINSEINTMEDLYLKNVESLKGEILQCNAQIEADFSKAPTVKFPSKYLNSILYNFISNALRYKSKDRIPQIKIETKKINDCIVLSVHDNGLGIDLTKHKENLFKIRKTFHNNPNAKGFGLYMTKAQVEAMDGRIWVESEPNKGSTFFVEFKNQSNETR